VRPVRRGNVAIPERLTARAGPGATPAQPRRPRGLTPHGQGDESSPPYRFSTRAVTTPAKPVTLSLALVPSSNNSPMCVLSPALPGLLVIKATKPA